MKFVHFFIPVFVLVACGQNDKPLVTASEPTTEKENPPVAVPIVISTAPDTTSIQPETELERLLSELNSWPTEELDAYERPEEYPGIETSGETNGWIDTHKALIRKEGGRVKWNVEKMRYELQ